jgi:NAD(P)-dependent dehydrogenase (short-subunit alcohol dehydrogenase family)
VFATTRRPEPGASLRELAASRGWQVETLVLDVTSDAAVTAAVSDVLRKSGGRLDVLVNNAGYYALGPLEETTPDELRAQLETNVIGVHRMTRAVLPAMRAQGSGRIVVLGSISGRVALPMVGPYHASKWALEGMIEAWRLELIPFGIRVALVEPGSYATALYANEKVAAATATAGTAGPYAPLMAAYRRQADKIKRERDLGPLLDVIERAATARNPKLRWMVGPTSFSGGRLRAFVPDRLYEWIMRLGFPIRRLPPSAGGG